MLLSKLRTASHSRTLARCASQVCIIAADPALDTLGAATMQDFKALAEQQGQKIEFYGAGGPAMQEQGLALQLGDVNNFKENAWFPHKNMKEFSELYPFNPAIAGVHLANRKALQEMGQSFSESLPERKPDLVMVVGNHLFARKLGELANQHYAPNGLQKPPVLLLNQFGNRFPWHTNDVLDHVLFSNPIFNAPRFSVRYNFEETPFPTTFTGNRGLYRAWSHLFSNSERHSSLVDARGLWINTEFNTLITENIILENRFSFRKSQEIGETVTLIFVQPGNTAAQAQKYMPAITDGVKQFADKYVGQQQISSENFAVVINVPEGREAAGIRAELDKAQWPCRVIIVDQENAKFDAICASDFGICGNGEIVSECAALQLPTMILEPRNNFETYMLLLYSTYANELNIAVEGEIYPELNGQLFGGKIAEWLETWYLNPSTKYDYIKRFSKLLPQMLVASRDETSVVSREGMSFQKFTPPNLVVADTMVDLWGSYRALEPVSSDRFREQREEMMESVQYSV